MATDNLNALQRQAVLAGGNFGQGIKGLELTLNLTPSLENQLNWIPSKKPSSFKECNKDYRIALSLLSGDYD